MKLSRRPYQNEDDYQRIRNFLRETFLLNDRRERNWHVARLDYWRWHLIKNVEVCPSFEQVTTIWEAETGQIGAVLHPGFAGETFLHVHPHFRTPELEDEMAAFAETHLIPHTSRQPKLYILVDEDDPLRQAVLKERGYTRSGTVHRWWRDLDGPLPEITVARPFTIRSMGGKEEYPARSWASWRAFHPDDPDDDYGGWEWYHNIQAAPLYRHDLDSGEIAAFCTIWFDEAIRSAVCVLVGTAPDYQRQGLGKAVIIEGLRRVKKLGGTRVFANAYDPPANALYGSAMGTGALAVWWVKIL